MSVYTLKEVEMAITNTDWSKQVYCNLNSIQDCLINNYGNKDNLVGYFEFYRTKLL